MSHSVKRKKSRFVQFRMAVPADLRPLVGKTEWTESLEMESSVAADIKLSELVAKHKKLVRDLRAGIVARAGDVLVSAFEQALERRAKRLGSIDHAVAFELQVLAEGVVRSWSETEDVLEPQSWGDWTVYETRPGSPATPSIEDEAARDLFRLKTELFEQRGIADGVVYREMAQILLQRRVYEPIAMSIEALIGHELRQRIALPVPDAVADRCLRRLAEHSFTSWPENLHAAIGTLVVGAVQLSQPAQRLVPVPTISGSAVGHTLQDGLSVWHATKRIIGKNKTADEFATAVERFVELTGISDVGLVTTKSVKAFRNDVAKLPARRDHELGALPLKEQIAFAEANGTQTLMAPTVAKQIAGVRAALAGAIEAEWISTNVAAGVEVHGSSWVGDERDHFSEEDMQRIYTSALMTDPDACDDTMFWILFLAPFHGSRPGEHCKLKPGEVVQEDGQWVMRIRRDRRTGKQSDKTTPARAQKTRSSLRDVPLHWIVVEAGFIDFVFHQRKRGAEWVFDDLKSNSYGDRYQALSQRINRALRKLGISDTDKAFYSSRHTMKREGRRHHISEQSLDQLAGHAAAHVGARYGQGAPIAALKDDIDRLEFRSVPWDAVVDCARLRFARLSQRK